MRIVDINVLLYATNQDATHHQKCRQWLENALVDEEPLGFAWIVVLGFLRIVTNGRIFPRPLDSDSAVGIVEEWFAQPAATIVVPTERHWTVLKELLAELGTAGNLTSDAHVAALAIERGARVYSTDNDFSRFSKVRWTNPAG